ncbi:MAG: hypothetical protein KAR57_01565 [Bacteroidales bacterium]|nr:hypothetical protein [Bacteroidales bacterium]
MRYTHLILFQVLLLFFSCSRDKNKDFSEVNALLEITDSLLDRVQSQYDLTTENFYKLIDDSLYVDSIFQNKGLSKSLEFYQNLEQNKSEYEDIFIQSKKEIYFLQDQLELLKTDFIENEISNSDYLLEISELKNLVGFLNERVDSNILRIDEKGNF